MKGGKEKKGEEIKTDRHGNMGKLSGRWENVTTLRESLELRDKTKGLKQKKKKWQRCWAAC